MILASGSPQRRAILESLGLQFEVQPSNVAELERGPAGEVALENARRKARGVPAPREGCLILAADTVVALDGRLYGKPGDEHEARDTLLALGGRTHTVTTAICLRAGEEERTAVEASEVTMHPADQRVIDWYLASREWHGRAGGYAIQGRGAVLIAGLRGDLTNVIGLPVSLLIRTAQGLLSVPAPA